MKPLFADTFYFLALVNRADESHGKAVALSEGHRGSHLVTTSWVLTELADALCRRARRPVFLRILDELEGDPDTVIFRRSQDLFEKGVELYRSRQDKDWSLTDCISFVVMEQQGLTDALTGDHHFEQAGFKVLLA